MSNRQVSLTAVASCDNTMLPLDHPSNRYEMIIDVSYNHIDKWLLQFTACIAKIV